MTREEFEDATDAVSEWTKYQSQPIHHVMLKLRNHDAEQRAVIERLDQLTTMQDGGIRSLHEQIVQKDVEITALKAQLAKSFNRKRFENEPPCYLCGYNGQNYFQPDTHPCAKLYHGKEHP